MAARKRSGSSFTGLRDRQESLNGELEEIGTSLDVEESDSETITAMEEAPEVTLETKVTKKQSASEGKVFRSVGRPKGRRSNPDYTQISAYIPLELLQSIQDVLAAERRSLGRRTARPVSDLVEELLSEWLKCQNGKDLKN